MRGVAVFATLLMAQAIAAASLTIEVRDGSTGEVVPSRIHLWDADGKRVKHPTLTWWHDHVTCEGEATYTVPPGTYRYRVARGPEFTQVEKTIEVGEGASLREVVTLTRTVNMAARGWWPGETHIHRPLEQVPLLVRAEEINIAPVITWWNETNPWLTQSPPEPALQPLPENRFLYALGGEDERGGGAFLYFNAPFMDVTQAARETPSALEFAALGFAAGAHVDMEKPFWWDMPAALALGRFHTIGIVNNHLQMEEMYDNEAWGKPRPMDQFPSPHGNGYWTQHIYYQVLNAGFRIAPSAGSASGVLKNPVGYNRAYVYLGERLDYGAWWAGLRAGRSIVTNGPLMDVSADGTRPGHVLHKRAGATVDVKIELLGTEPLSRIELIQNGEVTRNLTPEEVRQSGLISVSLNESGWFLLRAIGTHPTTLRIASTAPWYVELKDAPFKPRAGAVQFFINWIDERIARLRAVEGEDTAPAIALQEEARRILALRLPS